jgi:competence protein ComEC
VGSGALLSVREIALSAASLKVLAFRCPEPGGWHFALLGIAATGLLRDHGTGALGRARALAWAAALLLGLGVIELGARRSLRSAEPLRVSMLDVAQGDSTLLELPDGSAVLVDAGGFVGSPVDPGERVVLPWLRTGRRHALDIVVLSHPHPDHFGGLRSVVAASEVGEFWDSGQGEAEGAGPEYAALLALLRARSIPIRRPSELCSAPRWRAGVRLELLAPCPRFTPGRGANDNSLVLRVSFGKRSFLLTGDAEQLEERELIATGRRLSADVLKVGHHGSRTSTTHELLAKVRPRFATLSTGVRNTFGHPHAITLETLASSGVIALRTDQAGSLSFVTDGTALDLYAFSVPR